MMKQNSDFKNDIVRKLVSQRRMIRKLLKMTDQILECKNEPYELNLEKQQTQAFKQNYNQHFEFKHISINWLQQIPTHQAQGKIQI
eukprot:403368514